MTNNLKHKIIDAIAYSRHVEQAFDAFEIILLHQHCNQGMALSPALEFKLNQTITKMGNWERPTYYYNETRELQVKL